MNNTELRKKLTDGGYDARLCELYGSQWLEFQRGRYVKLLDDFTERYGERENAAFYSVPGRSEISGNHTDHNRGRVIAASIDLDIIAVAAPAEDGFVRVASAGFEPDEVDISRLEDYKKDHFCSSALIAGVCAGFRERGYKAEGFVASTTSNVLKGSGLSSSAAFEVMIGNLLSRIHNDNAVSAPELAMIAQYAENVYFGKPCGLMDQTACAVGGIVAIDFEDLKAPKIEKREFDLTAAGYTLCIVDTGGNHADLNEDYASVPAEMKAVAAHFGKEVLRQLSREDVLSDVNALREEVGDRAILRALHFFDENDRVDMQSKALFSGDLDSFFSGVLASGESSMRLLQNTMTTKNVSEQGLTLALDLAERALAGKKAAWRVHGGGFAGTIQAYVPNEYVASFASALEGVFGNGSVYALHVRPEGATAL